MADKINNNPWLGLSSYKYEDASRFYGRDKELQDLANIIRQNSFTTIYGVSGAGKTSIINAGLFPVLDKENYLPIYIRLNHGEGRLGYDDQIINAVKDALAKNNAESELMVEAKIDSELDKLWLYFHSHRFWTSDNHKLTPILFVDQFEEIFTKNEDVNDIWSFFNVIDSLQYNMPTERLLGKIQETDQCVTFGEEMNFRVVFSMREDFLPRLEDYCFDIPAMRRNRVGLKPLNGLQALEVITKPRPDVVSREVALHIISKIVGKQVKDNQRRLEATAVDTSILSLFCTELYNYGKIDENGGSITISLVDLYGGNILEWFYDRNMQTLPKKTYVYLENQLLTHSGYRNSAALEDLLENGVTQEQLDSLEENRIIRIEDVNHNLRVEFTHDVLCKIAKNRKDKRDSVERAKGEASARKAFTFDSSLFLFIVFSFFLALYYVGFNEDAFVIFFVFPLVFLIFMLFAHRHVADKNFSTMFWTLLGSIGFIVSFSYCSIIFLEEVASIHVKGTMYVGYLFIFPLLFLLSPILINIHKSLSLDESGKKHNAFFYVIVFLVFCAESFALSYWIIDNKSIEFNNISTWIKLLLYEFPMCLFLFSPAIILYKNKKSPTAWNIATAIYSFYEVTILALFIIGRNNNWYSNYYGDTFANPFLIIIGCIVVVYAFYGIQYMRQPKEQTFMTYCNNVLSFQSFKKYRSFGTRFKTVAIFFFIVYVWMTSTSYNDYVPFISLPLCCILVLYAASKEIDMTTKKKVFAKKILIPTFILTELIVTLQYTDGYVKQSAMYMAMLALAIGTFMFFAHNEILKGNKILVAKLTGISLLVACVLPMISVGYNIYNPSLTQISRVWGGCISSNLTGVNFLTIENCNGEKGVMDYSEIIIVPQYNSIGKECFISKEMYGKMHLIDKLIKGELFRISNFRGNSNDQDNIDVNNVDLNGPYLSFLCNKADGTSVEYADNAFINTKNKYGRFFTAYWLQDLSTRINFLTYHKYSDFESKIDTVGIDSVLINEVNFDTLYEYSKLLETEEQQKKQEVPILIRDDFDYTITKAILGFDNLNITDVERRNAIVQLFIKFLSDLNKNQFTEDKQETSSVLRKCYISMSLDPLLSNNASKISCPMIINATLSIAPLLCYDKSETIKKLILGQVWDKYAQNISWTYKPLCLLLANEREDALSQVKNGKPISYNSITDICNQCIVNLYTNNKKTAFMLIDNYANSEICNAKEAIEFIGRMSKIHKFMTNLGYEDINDNEMVKIAEKFGFSIDVITVDREMLNVPSEGGTYAVDVNCNSEWYIEVDADDWIDIEIHDNYVKLNVEPNYSSISREDYFVLVSNLNSVRINIKQQGF